MNKPGRILIVDDVEEWCEELAKLLRRNGFYVDAVTNAAQALEQLSTTFYHMVVLDIRLPSDKEGIELLVELDRRGLKEATKVVMHSAYGTMEHMRLAFKDYEVADFIPKGLPEQGDPETFLKSVQQIFEQKVKINLKLDVQWQPKSMIEQIVSNLTIDGKQVGRNATLRKQLSEELEDLFCRLFYEAEMIVVRPLTLGWSGTSVVLVQPFFKDRGRGEDVVVKFGDRNKIKKEHYNFEHYVKPFLSGARSTTVHNLRYTLHLGGIVYSLIGAGNDQLRDFAAFYASTDDTYKITDALNHLFRDTCANWHVNRSQIHPYNLATEYQQFFNYSSKKLERTLASHLSAGKENVTFPTLNTGKRVFINPLLIADKLSLIHFTSHCITHGDFNSHNLLVDKFGFTWLIDFQSTERGHILRDFIMLDSVIRFQLLTEQEASLEERLQMEDILCQAKHFSEVVPLANTFSTGNRALTKAYTAVVHLRTLAGNVIAQSSDDISEYSIGLFYDALNTLQFSTLDPTQHEHALLCASILADKLKSR